MPPCAAKRVPMIIDVDTGTDDALALLLACCCQQVDVLAITCVQGNMDVDTVTLNTLKVLDAARAPSNLPVARGFALPLVEPVTHCPQIHGQDGLGDLDPPLPESKRKPRPEHAVQLLNSTLGKASELVTVVCLAPLTNIAIAMRMEPQIWKQKVGRIVWMGGAVAGGGNARVWSEANANYDPEAAHMVLTSGVPILLYPWDVFLKVGFTSQELSNFGIEDNDAASAQTQGRTSRHPQSLLAGRLMYRELRHFKVDTAMIGDAGAVAAALLPEALTVRQLNVSVELHGERTRGMTVCDIRSFADAPDEPLGKPNADVVVDVDSAKLKSFFAQCVFGLHEDKRSYMGEGSRGKKRTLKQRPAAAPQTKKRPKP